MKKISIFFAAMLAIICLSSCSKDEVDVTIVDVRSKGSVQLIVRGYSIGTSGTSYVPEVIKKREYVPVEGFKITLANGQVITSDKNGKAAISLETGEYIIDKIDIPSEYYYAYDWNYEYDYETGNIYYIYILPENNDDANYYYRHIDVYSGHQEILIDLYKK